MGGWTEGLLAEGWRVVGFDIEKHEYGDEKYPAQLVLQDILTVHGSQFRNARLIVASPPCQAYSYMAMPWSRAKQIEAEYIDGTRDRKELTALFDACFRIQREAMEAAGRFIPLVVENVRGAQKWVGRARWNFGSFYLWGDVPALMPITGRRPKLKGGDHNIARAAGGLVWNQPEDRVAQIDDGAKVPGFRFDGSGKSFQTSSVEHTGIKHKDRDGYERNHPNALGWKAPGTNSKSNARKAANARIAKIPLTLSRHIGRVYRDAPLLAGDVT